MTNKPSTTDELDEILDEALEEYTLEVVDPIAADGVEERTIIRNKAKAAINAYTTNKIIEARIEGLRKAKELVIKRTEIPKDAKNPTRDLTVVIGETCAVVIEDEIYRIKALNHRKEEQSL